MADPERKYSLGDLFQDINEDYDAFGARVVGDGLQEIYKSGNYASMYFPEGSHRGVRTIEAVHLAAYDPFEKIGLLEFIPDASVVRQETLKRLLREQLRAISIDEDISEEDIANAHHLARQLNLNILGAFQLAILEGRNTRSTEVIFPLAFAKMTGSYLGGATLAAAFVRHAQ